MAYTVTGGKYALQTLTAVGTNTVTINVAVPFVVADFASIQRIVALFSSANAFKGIAWVRGATSTTELQLENPFIDPVNGNTITQVVGDRLLVSKNFAECVTAGLAVSSTIVTLSDYGTFGTAGSTTSLCLYDEYKSLTFGTQTGSVTTPWMNHAGGVFVTGHLLSWPDKTSYGSCIWNYTGTGGAGAYAQGLIPTSAAAHQFMFGHRVEGTTPSLREPAVQPNTVNLAGSLVWMSTDTQYGIGSPNFGGPWSPGTETRMCAFNVNATISTLNIAMRWGNGVFSGGGTKLTGATTLAVFGSGAQSVNTTWNIGADADQRFIVSDIRPGSFSGQATAFWDQGAGTINSTVNLTNIITPLRTVIRWATGIVTMNWYWKSAYQNLVTGSRITILRSDNSTVETSAVTVASSTDLTVLETIQSQANVQDPAVTFVNTAWTALIWKYAKQAIYLPFVRTTYSLGTAGNSFDVVHGGIFSQSTDLNITESNQATVNGYTLLATPNQVYDAFANWKSLSDANLKWGYTTPYVDATGTTVTSPLPFELATTTASAFLPDTGANTIAIKTTSFAPTTKFTALQAPTISVGSGVSVSAGLIGTVTNAGTISGAVTGNVANSGTLASGANITGNVTQTTPTSVTGVTITGNLTYNTNTPVTVTFTNTTITGTVSNSGTGAVTIRLANSTVGTAGANVTTQIVTALSFASLLADSQIYVSDNTGAQVAYVSSSGTSYNLDTTGGTGTWEWRLRKYGYQDQTGTFTPATSSESVVAAYLVDAFVVDTLGNVTAYTDLQTAQKIYDYSRYFATTNTGIALPAQFDKGFGTLTANSAFTLNPSAAALMAVAGGIVTTKTSGLAETVTVVVIGNFTQGAATLSNNVNIRATNLDSELLFSGIDSLTVYATQSDALNNTSPGATSTTGIIRFLYGAALSGVTMSGTVYLRLTLGTAIQVQSLVLVLGENEVNLSTTTLLQSVLAGVENVPTDVWDYTNRTINNALFT